MRFRVPIFSLIAVVALAFFAIACGGDDDDDDAPSTGGGAGSTATSAPSTSSTAPAAEPTSAPAASGEITLYAGRAEALVGPLIEQFQRETGITVNVRYAGSAELAATIQEEGSATPADVFWSQDPGPLGALSDQFANLPETILEKVGDGRKSDQGKWVGVSGRIRIVVYNPERVEPSEIPDSIKGFTDPVWQNRVGWAPTNASFQIMVTALRVLEGDDVALQWLQDMSANGAQAYNNNTAVLQAVAAGEVDVGLINHYYLHAARRTTPDISAENHYLNNPNDPGALIMVSGVGILSNTDNAPAAEAFVSYLLSDTAQQYFVNQTSEYPVTETVISPPGLLSFEELTGPRIDFAQLADIQGTVALLREAGVVQ